jgi:alanine racemase
MVRLGIGLYGVSNDPAEQNIWKMWVLKSVISQIRTISAGESVGYGRKFMAEKPTRLNPLVMQTEFLEVGEWRWICNYKDKKKQRY